VRYWWTTLVIVLLVVALGLWGPPRLGDAGYLLTVVAAIATLAGLGFAFYGWFASRELPALIDEKVRARVAEAKRELEGLAFRQQEAMQKVIASYAVDDPDRKIALLEQAIATYPDTYNVFVALGYAYLAKGDPGRAQECFREDLRRHPDNYQAASDLAALHAGAGEWLAALDWMREALRLRPAAWRDFEADERFAGLRAARPQGYRALIETARAQAPEGREPDGRPGDSTANPGRRS